MRNVFLGILLIFFTVQCQQGNKQVIKNNEPKASSIQPVRAAIGVVDAMKTNVKVKELQIKSNGSLYVLLNQFDFSSAQVYDIIQEAKKVFDVKSFIPGQPYEAYISEIDSVGLQKLVWHVNPVDMVVFNWKKDSLSIYKVSKPVINKTHQTTGTITSSLYEAVKDREARDKLVIRMTQILAWQIDFFNLRDGDGFKILYEKRYVGDKYFDLGEVKAVKFEHMGDTYYAYKFEHGDIEGYFNEEGKSVQKALLKNPFEYDYRISSHFGMRFHPILHEYRGHSGTDYAAPYGTPVHSTGDGVVITAGYAGAAGNMVKIKHNSTYKTAYMHMSEFADGIHEGTHVEQGEVIGYVGSTGRSTGAHLHYSVYVNGKPVNSLKLDLPSSRSIPDKYMDEFKKVRNRLHANLIKADTVMIASK